MRSETAASKGSGSCGYLVAMFIVHLGMLELVIYEGTTFDMSRAKDALCSATDLAGATVTSLAARCDANPVDMMSLTSATAPNRSLARLSKTACLEIMSGMHTDCGCLC